MGLFRLWNSHYSQNEDSVRELLFNFYYQRQLYAFVLAVIPLREPIGNRFLNEIKVVTLFKNVLLKNEVPKEVQAEVQWIIREFSREENVGEEALKRVCCHLFPQYSDSGKERLYFDDEKQAVVMLLKPTSGKNRKWKIGILLQ